jgi:hypothetical protein
MAKLKITAKSSITNVTYPGPIIDAFVQPQLVGGAHTGGTGGLTSVTGNQFAPQVYVKGGSSTTGSILAQKGAHKFRVTDGTNTGDCVLTNSAGLVAGQMNLLINTAQAPYANITVPNSGGTNTFGWITFATANLTSYTAPSVASVWTSTAGFAGLGTTLSYSVSGGLANANVSFSSQTVTSVTGTATVSTVLYASRIDNKFVRDFGSDGQMDSTSGTVTYYTSGFNPNKYKYHFAAPNSTFVQVQNA